MARPCNDVSLCRVVDSSSPKNEVPLLKELPTAALLRKLWPDRGFEHSCSLTTERVGTVAVFHSLTEQSAFPLAFDNSHFSFLCFGFAV